MIQQVSALKKSELKQATLLFRSEPFWYGTKLGEVQGDTIRKLTAHWYSNWENSAGGAYWDNTSGIVSSTITNDYSGESMQLGGGGIHKMILDSSTDVPSSKENRPVNVGVKYIIKAE